MTKQEKQDIISAWDEVEEAHCSLEQLDKEEITECKESIMQRLKNAMGLLGEYFTDEEAKAHIGY